VQTSVDASRLPPLGRTVRGEGALALRQTLVKLVVLGLIGK